MFPYHQVPIKRSSLNAWYQSVLIKRKFNYAGGSHETEHITLLGNIECPLPKPSDQHIPPFDER